MEKFIFFGFVILITSYNSASQLIPFTEGTKYGFKDESGKVIVKPKYETVTHMEDGVARVILNGKAGVINSKGIEIIKPVYLSIEKDELMFEPADWFSVKVDSKTFKKINFNGKELLFDNFDAGYSEGMIAVAKNKKWGFMEGTNHNIVIPFRFENAEAFWEERAAVKLNGKWGFIDKKGKEISPPVYEKVRNFHAGLAGVKKNGKWGFIDKAGKMLIEPQYDSIRADFWKSNDASVIKDGKKVLVPNPLLNKESPTKTEPTNVTRPTTPSSNITTTPAKPTNPVNSTSVTLKGQIDPAIAGTWKYENKEMAMSNYYVFRADGTYDYYPFEISEKNSMAARNCKWSIDGKFIEMNCPGFTEVSRVRFEKRNDPTGRAALMIEFPNPPYKERLYFTTENKKSW